MLFQCAVPEMREHAAIMRAFCVVLLGALLPLWAAAQSDSAGQSQPAAPASKPRVFVTDSDSWQITSYAGGTNGTWAEHESGGARPQTAEIIKTFGKKCREVVVNNLQAKSDYVVVLQHEGGKSFYRHKDKVAVFQRVSGDSIASKATLSVGGSVEDACDAIMKDWAANGEKLRAAAAGRTPNPASAPVAVREPAKPASARVMVVSVPYGADIEVDGNFAGNTPSTLELSVGEHTVVVRKSGYQPWERKLKLSGGDIRLNAEMVKEEAQSPTGRPSK
jgi:hypothetical protein